MSVNPRPTSKSKRSWPLPGSIKRAVDRMDAWGKEHLTPPGKAAGFKKGEAYMLPKSTGDAKGWLDYQRRPKKYRVK